MSIRFLYVIIYGVNIFKRGGALVMCSLCEMCRRHGNVKMEHVNKNHLLIFFERGGSTWKIDYNVVCFGDFRATIVDIGVI